MTRPTLASRYHACFGHQHVAAAGTALLLHHAVGWHAPDPAPVTTVLLLNLLVGCRVAQED